MWKWENQKGINDEGAAGVERTNGTKVGMTGWRESSMAELEGARVAERLRGGGGGGGACELGLSGSRGEWDL